MMKFRIPLACVAALAGQVMTTADAAGTPRPARTAGSVKPAAKSANTAAKPGPAQDKKGVTPPEYKRPNRWGL